MYNNSLDSKTIGWTLAVVFGITTFCLAGVSLRQNEIISEMKEHHSWVLGDIHGRLQKIIEIQEKKKDEEAE